MGRHSREGDSPVPTLVAPVLATGRHRTARTLRSISLTSFFRRSRHRPGAQLKPNEFGHTGADVGWSGTLTGIVAVTNPRMTPVSATKPKPKPVAMSVGAEFVAALMPSAGSVPDLELPAPTLDPPTHYHRLVSLAQHSTRYITVRGEMLGGPVAGV